MEQLEQGDSSSFVWFVNREGDGLETPWALIEINYNLAQYSFVCMYVCMYVCLYAWKNSAFIFSIYSYAMILSLI